MCNFVAINNLHKAWSQYPSRQESLLLMRFTNLSVFQMKFKKLMLVCGLIWKQYVISSLTVSNFGDAANDMHAWSCSKLWYWNIKQRMCYITLNNTFSVKWPPAILMIWLVAWDPIENVTVPKRAFSLREVALVIIWSSKAWGKMVNTKCNAVFLILFVYVKIYFLSNSWFHFRNNQDIFSDGSSLTL